MFKRSFVSTKHDEAGSIFCACILCITSPACTVTICQAGILWSEASALIRLPYSVVNRATARSRPASRAGHYQSDFRWLFGVYEKILSYKAPPSLSLAGQNDYDHGTGCRCPIYAGARSTSMRAWTSHYKPCGSYWR